MRSSFLLLLLCLLAHTVCRSQSIQWAQRFGNIKSDKVTSIKTDGLGNVYIAGYFSNNITLGTNALPLSYVANSTSKEAFVAKLDSNGVCLWAKAGGAYFDDRVLGMDVDSAGNCVLTGTYWEGSGINWAPLTITGNAFGWGDQCFILKLDPSGTPLWGTFVCGDNYGDDQGLDVVIDKAGNIYTVGFMTSDLLHLGGSPITATNNNTGAHKHSYWITKMNKNGVFQWARTFGNLPWDPDANKYVERDIAVCSDGADGIYITGGFDGTHQFGSQTFTSFGGHDIFVMKYDSNGVFKWATQGGSDKDDWSNGICSDKNGHLYITGEHRDSLIMDTVLVKNYDKRDVFIFKIDAQTGKPVWGKRAGSDEGSERGNDVWADDQCNVYVCGDINENAKFGDNILTPVNGMGVQSFVARITPEGKWVWAVTGGGPDDDDRGNALAKGKANQLYVAGFFRVSANFGGTQMVSAGSSDGYFMRVHDSMLNKGLPFDMSLPVKTVLCFGDTAHLKLPKHDYLTVLPAAGIQFNADSTELVFAPSVTTTYTIIGGTAGACGTADTISFTISVGNEMFTLTGPSDTEICPGESIQLSIPAHDHFQLSPGTGTTVNAAGTEVVFAPSATTQYTLSGYLTGICPSYDTISFTIVANPKPDASFDVTPETVFLDNPVFVLNNTTTGGDVFEWYDADNVLFSSAQSPSVTEATTGEYCYKLIARTFAGCVDSATDCGKIIRNEKVYFPNAFSPNGDSRNDRFGPVLLNRDLHLMKEYRFVIVNRFGEAVFKTNSPYDSWDGSLHGKPAELGTYFYTCKFVTPQGVVHEYKGDIALLY